MKKRPRPKATKPPPSHATPLPAPGSLQYKVVELSTVDEAVLERTLNQWVARGWTLDGVQFAMRESSKRPAMAFVFFTQEGPAPLEDSGAAWSRLEHLASDDAAPTPHALSAHERLAQLAGGDDDPLAPLAAHPLRMLEPDE